MPIFNHYFFVRKCPSSCKCEPLQQAYHWRFNWFKFSFKIEPSKTGASIWAKKLNHCSVSCKTGFQNISQPIILTRLQLSQIRSLIWALFYLASHNSSSVSLRHHSTQAKQSTLINSTSHWQDKSRTIFHCILWSGFGSGSLCCFLGQNIWVIDQVWGQDGWKSAKFSFFFAW